MRILVISDTHIPIAANSLPSIIEEEAKKSDCCLHAGDLVSYSVFATLAGLTKTYAVCGNMDQEKVKHQIPQQQVLNLEGIRLALIHGSGHPANLISYIQDEFPQTINEIDIFIFGHSHCASDKEIKGKIYFNPGSPTDKVFASYRSYGILDITGNKIERRIVKIE